MGGRERAREMRRHGPRLTRVQIEAADRVLALMEAQLGERGGGATGRGGQGAACESYGAANGPGTGEEGAWR